MSLYRRLCICFHSPHKKIPNCKAFTARNKRDSYKPALTVPSSLHSSVHIFLPFYWPLSERIIDYRRSDVLLDLLVALYTTLFKGAQVLQPLLAATHQFPIHLQQFDTARVISRSYPLWTRQATHSCQYSHSQIGATFAQSLCISETTDNSAPRYRALSTRVYENSTATFLLTLYFSVAMLPWMRPITAAGTTLRTYAAHPLPSPLSTPSAGLRPVTGVNSNWRSHLSGKMLHRTFLLFTTHQSSTRKLNKENLLVNIFCSFLTQDDATLRPQESWN